MRGEEVGLAAQPGELLLAIRGPHVDHDTRASTKAGARARPAPRSARTAVASDLRRGAERAATRRGSSIPSSSAASLGPTVNRQQPFPVRTNAGAVANQSSNLGTAPSRRDEKEAAEDEARSIGTGRRRRLRRGDDGALASVERLGDDLERVRERVRALRVLGLGIIQDVQRKVLVWSVQDRERKIHMGTLSRCRRSSKQRTPFWLSGNYAPVLDELTAARPAGDGSGAG